MELPSISTSTGVLSSPMTSTLKRKEQTEKELKRKEKQEEFRGQMSVFSEGAWKSMDTMNNKIAKIDSLVNQYTQQMEYLSSNEIQSYLQKTHSFYKNSLGVDPSDPDGQRTYANQYIYRKKLPTSFFYIERQKIRERIQLTTQMQFFHPELFEQKKLKKRQKEDIDYLKLLAKREENMNQKEPSPKHTPLNLKQIEQNRKIFLEEFYSKEITGKSARILELEKKYQISEEDGLRIAEICKKKMISYLGASKGLMLKLLFLRVHLYSKGKLKQKERVRTIAVIFG